MTDDFRAETLMNQIDRVRNELGDKLAAVEAERDTLRERVRNLVKALDDQNGTPCEQIRHRQEVEALEAKLAARPHLFLKQNGLIGVRGLTMPCETPQESAECRSRGGACL